MTAAAAINAMTAAVRANPTAAAREDGYRFGFDLGMEGRPLQGARVGRAADPRHRKNPAYRRAFTAAAREGHAMGKWTRAH